MNTDFQTNRSRAARAIEVNDARNFVADLFVRVTNFFCGVLARQDVVNALLAVIAACSIGNVDRNFAYVIGELSAPLRNFFYVSDPHLGRACRNFRVQVFAHAKRGDGVSVVDDEALTVVVIAAVPSPDIMVVSHRG